MATKLPAGALGRAIDHLAKFGDTDVFPHLVENVFLSERREAIVRELSQLDLDQFRPSQATETIAPKSRFGFRIVHQLPILETILFTAAMIEIAPDLERLKRPIEEYGPFAYRFSNDAGPSLFTPGHTYRDWLSWQRDLIKGGKFTQVIFTDISDFYHRIYFHRIENVLDVATKKKGINSFIKKLIKHIRSRQSYGIPVGGSASRILAEAVLADTDSALADEEYVFTRFVDDYRIFLGPQQDTYTALARFGELLATGEGLSLNAQKTRVLSAEAFNKQLESELIDVYDEAQKEAMESLTHAFYFDETPEEAELDKLRALNLVSLLEEQTNLPFWEFSKIRAIFLGLRLTQNEDAIAFFKTRIPMFFPFIKEVVLFLHTMEADVGLSSDWSDIVSRQLTNGATNSVPTIRVWLLELFVRGCLKITHAKLSEVATDETLSNRQIFLIRGLNKNVTYFRRNKARFDEKNNFEKYPFLLGATCLPPDEFRAWVSAIKPNMMRPLDATFCDWVQTKVGQLDEVINLRATIG